MRKIAPDNIRFEYLDDTPIAVPVTPAQSPNTLAKLMAQHQALQAQSIANMHIAETFEEADDFDVDDFEGALEYGKTKWEIAADAALMTPHELFERVYGVPHEVAYPPASPPTDKPSSDAPKT